MGQFQTLINDMAAHVGVAPAVLFGDCRQRPVAMARRACMIAARDKWGWGASRIARQFRPAKDHTTVLYAWRPECIAFLKEHFFEYWLFAQKRAADLGVYYPQHIMAKRARQSASSMLPSNDNEEHPRLPLPGMVGDQSFAHMISPHKFHQ